MSINNNHKESFKKIVQDYLQGGATEPEVKFLEQYYSYFEKDENFLDGLSDNEVLEIREKIWQQIYAETQAPVVVLKPSKKIRFKWVAAAAILVMAVLVTVFNLDKKDNTTIASSIIVNDKNPASASAQLVLADGTVVNLDSNFNGDIPNQGNIKLSIKDGSIAYNGNDNISLLNTINIPKGGSYFITLSDNTKVWLNAESSLQYPAAFNGNERRVLLTGEAYFEVAKNGKPFKVTANGKGDVEVLGTHFNINTYNNDIKTTLLEGSVKVIPIISGKLSEQNARLLRPGQQAVILNNTVSVNRDVDIEEVMAWRNNMFYFDNETLENILKEISRWYDVEVVFTTSKNIKAKRYFMMIDRSKQLSEALKSLQIEDVKFVISGNKLMIE